MEKPKRHSPQAAGASVLLILVMMILTAGFLAWNSGSEPLGMRASADDAKSKEVRNQLRITDSSEEEEATLAPTPLAPRPEPPRKRVHPMPVPKVFPIAENIPIGLEKGKLVSGFGRPNMITTAIDDGAPTETWLYRRPEPETETVVHLKNGKVVDADSTVY